ncbi:hypothetical protein AB0H76_30785 [Nocardia sp. NPDC050712]|uniref:hypothetical protein n=1 Tax=Nocardia sp. NPDC050712 TaxID=3155518 RepID=UPI0034015F5B
MSTLTPTRACAFCRTPATAILPLNTPREETAQICGACLAEHWAACEAAEDDYS